MRPAPRTSPSAAGGHRPATALAALVAVLLTLAAIAGGAGRAASDGAVPAAYGAAATAAADSPLPHGGRHTEDTSAAGHAAQVTRARHDTCAERPSAPDHHATTAYGTAVPSAGVRTSAPSAHPPLLPVRTAHDRVRAPPTPSGT